MKIIVDTNIIFSAILNSQNTIGQLLLRPNQLQFYSPHFLQIEIQNHFQRIKKITKLEDSELNELIDILYTKIHFISEELIPKACLFEAEKLTSDVDFDDVLFVALAIHLNCKLWTGDKILSDALIKKGFEEFISTQELKGIVFS
jgi:predicted nucleic acid-binding protein